MCDSGPESLWALRALSDLWMWPAGLPVLKEEEGPGNGHRMTGTPFGGLEVLLSDVDFCLTRLFRTERGWA